MISDRLSIAPAWVRWLVQSTIVTAYFVAFFVWVQPRFIHRLGWLWVLTAVIAVSAVEAGVIRWAHRDVRRRYLAALDGISNPQRLQALKALRTGNVPAEADVLAAAVRTGDLRRAYLRGQPRSQRLVIWVALVYAVASAIGMYSWYAPRYAAFFAVVALGFGIQLLSYKRRARLTLKNLPLLRAAADPVLPGLPPDDREVAVAFTKRQFRMLAVAITVPMVLFLTLVLVVDRARPDCGPAYAAAELNYRDRQLVEPQSVNWKSPDLSAYESWSDRLQRFSSQVSNPAVAPHLRRIADQSVQAVSHVREASSALADGGDHKSAEMAYAKAIQQIVDEEYAVNAYCS